MIFIFNKKQFISISKQLKLLFAVCSVLFCSVLFCSVLFCSAVLCSVLFCMCRCIRSGFKPVFRKLFVRIKKDFRVSPFKHKLLGCKHSRIIFTPTKILRNLLYFNSVHLIPTFCNLLKCKQMSIENHFDCIFNYKQYLLHRFDMS